MSAQAQNTRNILQKIQHLFKLQVVSMSSQNFINFLPHKVGRTSLRNILVAYIEMPLRSATKCYEIVLRNGATTSRRRWIIRTLKYISMILVPSKAFVNPKLVFLH